jgi:hypothetical protein
LTEFSHPITAFLSNQPEQPDTESWTVVIDRISRLQSNTAYIIDAVYRLLREQLNEPHPRLSEAQLFDNTTAADEKLDWIIHVLRLFRYWHNDLLLEKKNKFEPPLHTNVGYREKAYSIVGSISGKSPKRPSSYNRIYTNAMSHKPSNAMEFEYVLDAPTEPAVNGGAIRERHEFHMPTKNKPDLPNLIGTSAEKWPENKPQLDSKKFDQLVQIHQEIQTVICNTHLFITIVTKICNH